MTKDTAISHPAASDLAPAKQTPVQQTPVHGEPSEPHLSKRAADELFQNFEQMIITGVLKDGEALPPEREIVETYKVSRTVVREAIHALSNKGLIEARPRFRPIVRKPGFDAAISTIESVVGRFLTQPDGVKHLFDTRIMIEASLVRDAAKHAKAEDLKSLKNALEVNYKAINDSDRFYDTDTKFHQVLYTMSDNPLLPSIHKAYKLWLSPYWLQMPKMPDRNEQNYNAHKAIYDAILMRNPDEAEQALRAHLNDAWNQVKEAFDLK